MKHSPVIWFLLLLLLIGGCTKGNFSIEVKLPAQVNENYNLLYYASDSRQGFLKETVIVVHQGECRMECPSINPTLGYIFAGASEPALVFYAERGDKITFTGDNARPDTWRVGGNDINEELSDWRAANRDALSAKDIVRINAAVAGFVKKNPENPVSTLLLLLYYSRGDDSMGFDRLYKTLKGEAVEPGWTGIVGRSDMISGFVPSPSSVPQLVFTTPEGPDTVTLTNAGCILYFSYNGNENRREDIQVLRNIIRMRKDSASFAVVDVNMEVDSASWRYQLPNDSLSGAVRAWMPLGFSDAIARYIGVSAAPWFVVTDNNGRILYNGPVAGKAEEIAVKLAAQTKKPETKPEKKLASNPEKNTEKNPEPKTGN